MNTFKEYILGEEVEKDGVFIGMPQLKWEKSDPFKVLLKGEFLNCQSSESRQRLKADMESGKMNKTQMARAKKQAIEFIGSIVNASQLAKQNGISIAELAKRMAAGGVLLASANDKTPYFIAAHRSVSGFDAKAILPVKDLKSAAADMVKVLASELKTGKNPFLCIGRNVKPRDIVVPKLTNAMINWIGAIAESK